MAGWYRRLRARIRYRRHERDLARELEVHRALKREELESSGHPPATAARQAARDLGNVTLARERARAVWIAPWLQGSVQDIHYGLRVLTRERWFSATAIVALALGIAVVSMTFTIINGYYLRALPVRDGDRLLFVATRDRQGRPGDVSLPDFEDWRRTASTVSNLAAFRAATMTVRDQDQGPESVSGAYVSAAAFDMLGEEALVGRRLQPDDERPGAPPVVVLGHRIWASRYSASRNVIGRTVSINGTSATVVGVMRDGFEFPFWEVVWLPMPSMPGWAESARDDRSVGVMARLADGATRGQAQAELETIAADLARRYPQTNSGVAPTSVRFGEQQHGRLSEEPMPFAAALAGLVLLIGCANVANLLLARGAGRTREMAIRAAIGATRTRIVRQLLVESVMVAAAAGLVGLWLSTLGVRLVRNLMGANLPYWMEFTVDVRVLLVLGIVCLVTSLVSGLMPTLVTSRTNVSDVMKEDARAGSGRRSRRWTAALLVSELALTLVLLAASGLMVRSFLVLAHEDRVIDASRVLTARVKLPDDGYAAPAVRQAFYAALEERLSTMPGGGMATVASARPFAGGTRRRLEIDGRAPIASDRRGVLTIAIGLRYFESIGVGVLAGRSFTGADGAAGPDVAIVNERFAETHFPNGDVLGQRVRMSEKDADPAAPWLTIVGVSPTIRQNVASGASPVIYTPLRSFSDRDAALIVGRLSNPAAVVPLIRQATAAIDPDVIIYNVRPLTDLRADSRLPQMLISTIFGMFAVAGLVLSMVGVYSVTAYSVRQRMHEVGVRLALGAGTSRIVWLFVRRAVLALTFGLAFGSVGAYAVGQLLQGMLVRTMPTDPVTMIAIVLLLTAVTAVACVVPSIRASRLDPHAILRRE